MNDWEQGVVSGILDREGLSRVLADVRKVWDTDAMGCRTTYTERHPDAGPGTPCPHCDQAAVVDEHGCCIHCGMAREHVHTWGDREPHPRLGMTKGGVRYCTGDGCDAFTTADDDEDAAYERLREEADERVGLDD